MNDDDALRRMTRCVVRQYMKERNMTHALRALLAIDPSECMSVRECERRLGFRSEDGGTTLLARILKKRAKHESASNRKSGVEADPIDVKQELVWSKDRMKRLKSALRKKKSGELAHWDDVAAFVGDGVTKKECYAKYKSMRAAKKAKRCNARHTEKRKDEAVESVVTKDMAHGRMTTAKVSEETTPCPPVPQRDGWFSTNSAADASSRRSTSNADTSKHVASTRSIESTVEIFQKVSPIATKTENISSKKRTEECADIMAIEDFDDDADDAASSSLSSPIVGTFDQGIGTKPRFSRGTTISLDNALDLRTIVFGQAKSTFPSAWAKQGLYFCDDDPLKYGLVQNEGGPCGPLAVVQAHVLKYLHEHKIGTWRDPSADVRKQSLLSAIGDILWRIGRTSRGRSVVALVDDRANPSKRISSSGRRYRPDGVTERLILHTFDSRAEMDTFLRLPVVFRQFTAKKGFGVVLLVYSSILSRGIDRVSADMGTAIAGLDTPRLMGRHDYAGQELVNLMIAGGAYTQVFNGTRTIDEGVRLMGVPSRCDVGFLTLFERYGYVEVGTNLKTPRYPIWVVCSESHYSVLFCAPGAALGSQVPSKDQDTDLFYFDGLARQDEEIRLSVTANAGFLEKDTSRKASMGFGGHADDNEDEEDELIPPLDSCIRTRWKGATVDWNDTEPLI